MKFTRKSKEVREVFTLKASERELASLAPMELSVKRKDVREVFTLKASERGYLPHYQWSSQTNSKK